MATAVLTFKSNRKGSTCALFTNTIHNQHGVKAIAVGGIAGDHEMSYSSFIGGQSFSLDSLRDEITHHNLTNFASTPKEFSTKSRLSFTIREVYNLDEREMPEEFLFFGADERVANTQEFDFNPVALWRRVAGMFAKEESESESVDDLSYSDDSEVSYGFERYRIEI
jgi:hypothetical protein